MNHCRTTFSVKAITGIDLLVSLGLRQVGAESPRRVASGGFSVACPRPLQVFGGLCWAGRESAAHG